MGRALAATSRSRDTFQPGADNVTTSLFFTGLVLPALLFTLVYFPALKRALVLASPYPKATLAKRMYAAAIDGLLVTSCWVVYSNAGSLPYAVIAMIYLLLRDSFAGQSIGKFLVGQVVVHVDTGQRCRLGGSLKRNLFLVLPGANVVASGDDGTPPATEAW